MISNLKKPSVILSMKKLLLSTLVAITILQVSTAEVTIQADRNGLCLDVFESDISNDTPLILATCSTSSSQKWIIAQNGFIQSSVDRSKCIQVVGQNYQNSFILVMQDCMNDNENVNDGQKWEMTEEGTIKSNHQDTNYCFRENGVSAAVSIWTCDETSEQQYWTIISVSNEPSMQPSNSVSTTPSLTPSSSSMPSNQPSPSFSSSPSVSISPTGRPSVSFAPSSKPTWSPTISSNPTRTPTQQESLVGIDYYDRRHFPKNSNMLKKNLSYQQILNCTSTSDNPGCVSIPKSIFPYTPWAGKIHSTPPSCNKRKKYCDQGVPMSLKTYALSGNLIQIDKVKEMVPIELPGGAVYTESIVAADVNGDGMVDIIVGNKYENNQLLLNQGDGNFYETVDLPGGVMNTYSIAAVDVNGDGMVDIIVGNGDTISGNSYQNNQLLMNKGNGTFNEAFDLPGGAMNTLSIVAADVNGDGMVDLVIGNSGQNNQLLMNNGHGSYTEAIDLPGNGMYTQSLAAADVNGDDMVDIIVVNSAENNQLLLNNGGNFSDAINLPQEHFWTLSVAIADVNGDGMVDILFGKPGDSSNKLLLNDGDGSYSKTIDLPGGMMWTRSIAVADINGDGMVDVIIGNGDDTNQLLINEGDGSYNQVIDLPGGAMNTQSITVADVNGDGMADIIIGNENQNNQVLISERDGRYSEAIDIPGGTMETVSIAVADMNGDGMVDILIGNENQNNQLMINEGDGSYSEAIDLPGGDMSTYSIAAADINNDGMLDIIIANQYGTNQLLLNQGDGNFSDAIDLPGGALKSRSIAAADVNGDGMLDLIIAKGWVRANNMLLMNNGDGNYSEVINLPGSAMWTFSIAAADVNGDGMVDIIIGRWNQNNQLLLNQGDGVYSEVIDLPGGYMETYSIVAADINGDGMIDIIIGNENQSNQLLLNNGDGNYFEAINLPGGEMSTQSIIAADVNGDGMIDVIIGNSGQNNQLLLNNGGGFSDAIDLPGGDLSTTSIAVADVNGDGIVDFIIGHNQYQHNQVLLYDSCPNGGAQLHSASWCFQCPSFMGRDRSLSGLKNYMCRECIPDYVQQVGDSERCEPNLTCVLGGRKLGEDSCSDCSDGTYYDNQLSRLINDTTTWDAERCVSCPNGTFASKDLTAIDECFPCNPGTYQPMPGSSSCHDCPLGSYQPGFGKDRCELCSKGGYCGAAQKIDGGFTPCPPGTHNNKLGESNITACIKCPLGTYSTENGAEDESACLPCPSGTYNNQIGQTSCRACDEGTFQALEGQTSCDLCEAETFADITNSKKCIKCPYRLSSINGSSTCPFCAQGFFFNDTSSSIESFEIFQNPFTHCLQCPLNGASCQANTTLSHLNIQRGYWRHSSRTSTIYPCRQNSTNCIGMERSSNRKGNTKNGSYEHFGDMYCKEGHEGPLCEVCTDNNFYFSETDGNCVKCPSPTRVTLVLVAIVLAVAVVAAVAAFLVSKYRIVLASYMNIISNLSLRAKLKILVSFCQILSSLEDVYGVRLHDSFTVWMNMFSFLSFDLIQMIGINTSCIASSTLQQVVVGALWPYILVLVLSILAALYKLYLIAKISRFNDSDLIPNGAYIKVDLKSWIIRGSVILFYFVIPTVSTNIFDEIKCRAFDDDDLGSSVSYLLIDMDIKCDTKDTNYSKISAVFWVFFVVWIILTPLGFVALLAYIKPSVQSMRITPLAKSIRFLWQDYDPSMLYWDVIDTLRKIVLTGAIMFIDTKEGSNKLLRLVIAGVVSVVYFGVLLAFHPYKRRDDYNLAFLSNLILIFCFLLGIVLKLCGEADKHDDDKISFCTRFIGDSFDFYRASLLVVILTVTMLLATISLVAINAMRNTTESIVRMVSTRYSPNLELPEECSFHIFLSHVWSTGQSQTHAIVRKMQLFMPGLKIWLDVDELTGMDELEESVKASAVFVIFYSRNYFWSKNCQRELYTAIQLEKPIIVLYKGDQLDIERMMQSCISHCNGDGSPGATVILQRIFGNDNEFGIDNTNAPILWLDVGHFSAAALNQVYCKVLSNLPYYKENPTLLNDGIMVPGEIGSVSLKSPINILTCESNYGASDIADELKATMLERDQSFVSVHDAATFLHRNDAKSALTEEDGTRALLTERSDSDSSTYLLLYLNKYTFSVDDERRAELTAILESCIKNPGINVVLVHEHDIANGGCEFGLFFKEAPEHLINEPYNLFKEIATTLYSEPEYRIVSLKMILCKMGAVSGRERRNQTSMISSIKNSFRSFTSTS